MLISLSGNNQVAPSFWLNRGMASCYNVGVQTSQCRIDSLDQAAADAGDRRYQLGLETTGGSLAGAAGGQRIRQVVAGGASQACGNPGAMTGRIGAAAVESRGRRRSYGPVIINHYRRRAGLRHLLERGPPRPGQRGSGGREDRPEGAGEPAARHHADAARRVRNDADVVLPSRAGDHLRRRPGLPPHGGELPVVARPVHHPHGAAGRDGGNPLDALRHRDDAERAVAGGAIMSIGVATAKQHPAGHVCER